MRRLAVLAVLAALVACGPRAASTSTIPSAGPAPLGSSPLAVGEAMEWDVYWQGLLVGHADLDVQPTEASSKFSTTALARTFAKVRYHLTTSIDRAHSTESLDMPGTHDDVVAAIDGAHFTLDAGPRADVPGGSSLHTLHTALASVRAWSRGPAQPGYLWLLVGHTLYRLDVASPSRDEAQGHRALRIPATIRALDHSLDAEVTIWLSTTADRTPLRFVVTSNGQRVSAELTATTARL